MNRFGALLLGLALAGTFVGCGDVELVGDTPLCSTTVIKKCITDKYGIPWCEVTPGSFMMGSAETEPCREQSGTKETRHKVTLTRKFQVAQYETTQTEYLERMKTNPSKYSGSDAPVESVTWHQSAAYCNKLSQDRGITPCYLCSGSDSTTSCTVANTYEGAKIYQCPGYRLPTEAEWEYAYRAGKDTAYYVGGNSSSYCNDCTNLETNADAIGYYCANIGSGTGNRPQKPGQKTPNGWGIYDMAGNVSEWVHDTHKDDLGSTALTDPVEFSGTSGGKVRGGSIGNGPSLMRAAHRSGASPRTGQDDNRGFRCVQTLGLP